MRHSDADPKVGQTQLNPAQKTDTRFKPGDKPKAHSDTPNFRTDIPRNLPENFAELSVEEQRRIVLTRRLTPAEYEEAKLLYQRDGVTLKDLSKRFGFTPNSFLSRFKRDGIVKNQLANLEQKLTQDKVMERLADKAEEIATRHLALTDTVQKGLQVLTNQLIKTNVEAIQRGRPHAAVLQDNRAIVEAIKGLGLAYKTAADIASLHGQRVEDELPELSVRVMDEQDVLALRRQEELENMMMGDLTGELAELSGERTASQEGSDDESEGVDDAIVEDG